MPEADIFLEDCKLKLTEIVEDTKILVNKMNIANLFWFSVTSYHIVYRIRHDMISFTVQPHNTNTTSNSYFKFK